MTRFHRPVPLVAAAIALAAAASLAACSSGGTASSGSSGSAVTAGGGASSGASQPAADATKVCTLASFTQVQAAVQATPPITTQSDSDVTDGGAECGYTSDDRATILVNVMVFPSSDSAGDLQHGAFDGQPLSPVSGVGSKAAVGSGELDAIVGSKGLVVLSAGDTDLSQDQIVALAKLVAPKIR